MFSSDDGIRVVDRTERKLVDRVREQAKIGKERVEEEALDRAEKRWGLIIKTLFEAAAEGYNKVRVHPYDSREDYEETNGKLAHAAQIAVARRLELEGFEVERRDDADSPTYHIVSW